MVERIDAFAHALPEQFKDSMKEIHPTEELLDMSDSPHLWDIEHRLSDMDEFGINKQCIMLARSTIWQGLDEEDALSLTQAANDSIATLADESDRLIPVATIPFVNDAFVEEFRRCIEDLGMVGAQIFSNVEGRPIDSKEFHPLYAEAERLDAPLWIHPQLYEWSPWAQEYGNDKIFGWLFDTSLALSRLVFSGTLQKYPDLNIIPHHMGAMIPFFEQRIKTFTQAYSHLDYADLDAPVLDYFRRFYPDTAVNGSVPALECGIEFFGTEQVVFGTDYPFGPNKGRTWMKNTVTSIEDSDLTSAEREQVFHENISNLIY